MKIERPFTRSVLSCSLYYTRKAKLLAVTKQKELYSILFQASAETLLELEGDRKYFGAEIIGFTSIMHIWGQNLMHHTHVYYVVPSGDLSIDGTRWINN